MKPVRELREASRQMGRQTLRVAAPLTEDARLAAYLEDVERGPGARPPRRSRSAWLGGRPRLDERRRAAAFLYCTRRPLLVGAALRLLPMGQLEGQRVLWRLHPLIARGSARGRGRRPPTISGASRPGSTSRACATRSSTRGCSARERPASPLKIGIGGPGRLGQDRARRGALRAGSATATTSR